jgi:hypothetical protein
MQELRSRLSKVALAFGRVVLYLLIVFVFCALRARKTEKKKYHAAARPELVEGQAKRTVNDRIFLPHYRIRYR